MKTVTSPTLDAITNGYHNEVGVIVHAEWKWNRFARAITDNTPSEDTDGYDIEMFPIDSIIKQNRPTSGIAKAVVGQSKVESNVRDTVPTRRYYMASPDALYKYWQSPLAAGAGPGFAITNCAPQVVYVEDDDVSGSPVGKTVKANKIHYTIENSYASPTAYTVQIKTSVGGSWTTVATNVTVPTNGKVELWYNGTNWTTTKNLTATPQDIYGVRLVVTAMSASAYFNLVELGVSLQLDLTSDVVKFDSNFNMGEADFITPLGQTSSNEAGVEFFSETRRYSNENASSDLFGLLDRGIYFEGWTEYNGEAVKEFTMVSDIWDGDDEGSASVKLLDDTKIFMDSKPPAIIYQNIPIQEAVWRICDLIGFNNYNITTLDTEAYAIVDTFWTDGNKTAWEVFGELSRGTQTAIYFDSFGVLQVKTRNAAFNQSASPSFTLRRNTVPGGTPANIESLKKETNYEANKVIVNYKPTGFSEQVGEVIPFETVWEPDGDVVLRASELMQSMTSSQMYLLLKVADAKTWPFKGIMNIEGEWISYEGKQYSYILPNGTRTTKVVTSQAEKNKLDNATNPTLRYLNQFNGKLIITERGLYNTDPQPHYVGVLNGWTKTRRKTYSTNVTPCPGISLNRTNSTVVLDQGNFASNTYTYLHRGSTGDAGYKYIGTRLMLNASTHKTKQAGIFFNGDGGVGTGYFVEVTATTTLDGKKRKNRNEIIFYSMKSDGTKQQYGGPKSAGVEFAVPQNTWVELDIIFITGTNHKVQIWANGQYIMEANIPDGSGWQHSSNAKFGLYARGNTKASFDYAYAVNNFGPTYLDDESYLDRIEGGYRGSQYIKDWTYDVRTVRRKVKGKWTKQLQKYNQRFYDEFGPVCHEIRKFDVKFGSDKPSLQSKLYFSNTTQVVATEFWSDPMNAHFILANITRENAVVNGEDTLTTRGNGSINHKLLVYGRPVIQKDQQQIIKTDDKALRKRGVIETEYATDWIQNEAEGENFSNWLTTHWTDSDAELEVEIFGNPLIELTDVVHVLYNSIDSDFYVTSVNNTFDSGLSTKLKLRKVQ